MQRRRTNKYTTRNLILSGVVCGAIPWVVLRLFRESIIPSGSDVATMIGATLAFVGLHAPWLSNVCFDWPFNATDLGSLIVNILYYPLLFLLIARIVSSVRKTSPDDAPACMECGYNLTGNQTGRCPECGQIVNQPIEMSASERPIESEAGR